MTKTPSKEELEQFIQWYYIRRRKKLAEQRKSEKDANDYQIGRAVHSRDHWAMKRGFK